MSGTLLIGGYGQLGTEIRRTWNGVVAPPHAELDLENTATLATAIDRHAPDVIVNCAAFHDVDRCESEPERAFAVNALAVGRVARLCRDRAVRFVTVSSDYVFDGRASQPYREDDPTHPVSIYGASRLAGELLVEIASSDALVVRTCGVYGPGTSAAGRRAFVDRVLAQARAGQPLRIVDDVVSPTFAGHLADALRFLIDAGATGLYHAANAGPVSWYEFAREALAQERLETVVEPISSSAWQAPAKRPPFSALESGRLADLGFEMPSWREGIASYLLLSRLSERDPNP